MGITEIIAVALAYAETHLALEKEDETFFANLLLDHFGAKEPFTGSLDRTKVADMKVPDAIFDAIVKYDVEVRLWDPSAAERDATWVLGLLSPRPSSVTKVFNVLKGISPERATEYLYDLSIKNDYIQKSKVDKNLHWVASFTDGPKLEISINLSKPEKNNKDIAKLLTAAPSGYPQCLLCKENVGFAGNASHPARENIRVIPITLGGGRWYLQYSPYVYYSHHCIVFYDEHIPMAINPHILRCLFDFVDQFPHFFIGSNSDLPIVGGSILNHEHFQGGGHEMPMMKAGVRRVLPASTKTTSIAVLNFYDTVLKLSGPDKEEILSLGAKITDKWRNYDDRDHSILSRELDVQHSTVTPIVRKVGGVYEFFLILRNNYCTKDFPDGLFHVHPEYQYIKQEGIGLIEAAGLFILPARLVRQGQEAEEVTRKGFSYEQAIATYPDLKPFAPLLSDLQTKKRTVQGHIGWVCQRILENVAVYKNNEEDQKALDAFVKEALA